MRETDLLAFEIGLRVSNAAGVMCAYNKIDGDWACENEFTLTRVLRKAWGFQGWVMSDWGATHSTAKAALAGLDQEMPGSGNFGDKLKAAVEAGEVPMARLNEMAHRILRSMFAVGVIDNPPRRRVPDVFRGLADAQYLAEQCLVLLKNANGQLPLAATLKSIAVIGSHADVGMLSGGGSAQVDPPGGNAVAPPPQPAGGRGRGGFGGGRSGVYFPDPPLAAIQAKVPAAKVKYASGADLAAAAALAKASDVAIVFVNQPMSEGRDAATLELPENQDALVEAVAAANPKTVVVLETGGPVTMPWIDRVNGVLAAFYPGIRGAEAIANVLFGEVNPSGKLAVTFPKSDADLPHPKITGMDLMQQQAEGGPGRGGLPPFDIHYDEGLKVGYKWYDAENKQPLFGFGYGLSYTTFAYSALKATPDGNGLTVTFTLRNTGRRAGAEVAEVYASLPTGTGEPPKRLIGWQKVALGAGESKTVTIAIEPLHLSVFNELRNGWQVAPGEYQVMVGGSSRSLPLKEAVKLAGN